MVIKTMRIKPTSSYEDMWIYYTIDVVRLLHVQPPTVANFREVFFKGYIAKYVKTNLQI
jgi:hypothetical protein